MHWFRNLAIKNKLMVIIMVTTVLALVLASVAFFAYDFVTFRRAIVEELGTFAETLKRNTTNALVFNDRESAEAILAGLEVQPHVVSAAIYSRDGDVFAQYRRPQSSGGSFLLGPRAEGHTFEDQHLLLFRDVRFGQETVGTFQINSDLEAIRSRLRSYGGILAVVLFGVSLVSLVISSRLQRLVSEPILDLVRLEDIVIEKKDYTVRAQKKSADELGLLIDGFNEMLTQIQERDAELRVARDDAEEANRSKSVFLANMSHELRTPLNAIIGYSEMLEEECEDLEQEDFIPDLQKIRTAGKHLLGLINSILDLSKVEAGKMDLFNEEFDLETLVDEVRSTATPLIEQNGNTLEIVAAEDLGSMCTDLTKVRQVLFNLLSNAAKFTEHGEIRLEVEAVANDERSWVLFRVVDSGIGMTDEQLRRVFEPFSQAEASTTRKYGGTGLGLSICRRFCRMMGGDIQVESAPQRGSTFTVKLPTRIDDADDASSSLQELMREGQWTANASETQPSKGERDLVLVIDDDLAVHELLADILHKEGFSVAEAHTATDGMKLARQLRPQVITLDVRLPDHDGWTVLSNLKSDSEVAHIPVIMISIEDNRRKGFAFGASEYLTKPVERDRLAVILDRYRGNGRGTTSALVIDDDAGARELMRRLLEGEGWFVQEAANGVAGLRQVASSRPDLIVLDLMMPELDGFGFVAELRKTPEWRAIPIVVVTSAELGPEERARLNGGVDQILEKDSFSLDELKSEIRSLCRASVTQ